MGVVATNTFGRALSSEMYVHPQQPVDFVRFLFLDPRGRAIYHDWNDSAEQIVALLRAESGRMPSDGSLRSLISELSNGSSEFAALEAHDVRVQPATSSSITPTWATSISATRPCSSPFWIQQIIFRAAAEPAGVLRPEGFRTGCRGVTSPEDFR